MNEQQKEELVAKLLAYADELTTGTGAKLSHYDGHPLGFVVCVTCDGRDLDMGYNCCLSPGHDGQCYSASKRVHFDKESRNE